MACTADSTEPEALACSFARYLEDVDLFDAYLAWLKEIGAAAAGIDATRVEVWWEQHKARDASRQLAEAA